MATLLKKRKTKQVFRRFGWFKVNSKYLVLIAWFYKKKCNALYAGSNVFDWNIKICALYHHSKSVWHLFWYLPINQTNEYLVINTKIDDASLTGGSPLLLSIISNNYLVHFRVFQLTVSEKHWHQIHILTWAFHERHRAITDIIGQIS